MIAQKEARRSMAAVLVSLALAAAVLGSAPTEPPAAQQPAPPSESPPGDSTEDAKPSVGDPFVTSPEVLEAHLTQLRGLHAAVREELKLGPEQSRAVDVIFASHLRMLTETGGRRPPPNPDDAMAVDALRKKLIAAREAGDEAAIRKLTEEFTRLIESRPGATGLTTDQFFAKIIAVLDKDQTAAFRKLIKKLRVGDAKGPPSENLSSLWRAVMQPEVGLSDAQRQAIHRLRAEAKQRTAEARSKGDHNRLPQIGAEIRQKVMQELTPDQQIIVEKILSTGLQRSRVPP